MSGVGYSSEAIRRFASFLTSGVMRLSMVKLRFGRTEPFSVAVTFVGLMLVIGVLGLSSNVWW